MKDKAMEEHPRVETLALNESSRWWRFFCMNAHESLIATFWNTAPQWIMIYVELRSLPEFFGAVKITVSYTMLQGN
jgi:hypothetical protein